VGVECSVFWCSGMSFWVITQPRRSVEFSDECEYRDAGANTCRYKYGRVCILRQSRGTSSLPRIGDILEVLSNKGVVGFEWYEVTTISKFSLVV
jgi:hypothetical protein